MVSSWRTPEGAVISILKAAPNCPRAVVGAPTGMADRQDPWLDTLVNKLSGSQENGATDWPSPARYREERQYCLGNWRAAALPQRPVSLGEFLSLRISPSAHNPRHSRWVIRLDIGCFSAVGYMRWKVACSRVDVSKAWLLLKDRVIGYGRDRSPGSRLKAFISG